MSRFVARAGGGYDDETSAVSAYVLAEHPDGAGRSLEIQRAHSFDKQARELGMDTYCLVLDSGPTCYGGVVSWGVDGASTLILELDDRARSALGTPKIEIELALGDVEGLVGVVGDLLGIRHGSGDRGRPVQTPRPPQPPPR